MKKIFVDTNIIVDLIADRKPYSKFAIEIFEKVEHKKIKLYTSSHSIATTHYLLKKYIDEKKLRDILCHLLDYITVIAVDQDVIKKGLKSKHKDFEDAIQITAAESINDMFCIVTRDLKDYKLAQINVFTPDEFLNKIIS